MGAPRAHARANATPPEHFWYLRATARFGWLRDVLLNQINAGAYERAVTEKKTHNFDLALREHFAAQADEMLKSCYILEFLSLRRAVLERELEDRLVTRLQSFLLEMVAASASSAASTASPSGRRCISSTSSSTTSPSKLSSPSTSR